MTQRTLALSVLFLLFVSNSAPAADSETPIEVTVAAGEHDRMHVPLELTVPRFLTRSGDINAIEVPIQRAVLRADSGETFPAQLMASAFFSQEGPVPETLLNYNRLHFILPNLPAGKQRTYRLLVSKVENDDKPSGVGLRDAPPEFAWHEVMGESIGSTELRFGDRPVLRYMRPRYDGSTPESHEKTKKVFHHVFDPATGRQLLTKGAGGLYSHHRGIFYGFSKLRYGGGKTADVWHCNNGESQRHLATLAINNGRIMGHHRLATDWKGSDKQSFALEHRDLRAFNIPGGTLIEFRSELFPDKGPLEIDGDPQHAGFQFRAAQEVAEKTKDQTYYLRPDGRGKPGETRNWDHKNVGQESNKQTENLPWNAMSFVVGGKRYTALYLDHPDNPKPARYSERDYGRFGSYFEKKLAADEPLKVRYRLWIQEGEMTVEQCARLSADFIDPPTVSVRRVRDEE